MPAKTVSTIKVAREKIITLYRKPSERDHRELKEEIERMAASDYRVLAIRKGHGRVDVTLVQMSEWSADELLEEMTNAVEGR